MATLFEQFKAIVRSALHDLPFRGVYGAKVISQRGDGTLDLIVNDERIAQAEAVPYRTGIPGIKLKVEAGAECLLTFEDADPTKPVAFGFKESGLVEAQLGGTLGVARVSDSVTVDLAGIVLGQPMSIGAPFQVGPGVTATGTISTGSKKVLA